MARFDARWSGCVAMPAGRGSLLPVSGMAGPSTSLYYISHLDLEIQKSKWQYRDHLDGQLTSLAERENEAVAAGEGGDWAGKACLGLDGQIHRDNFLAHTHADQPAGVILLVITINYHGCQVPRSCLLLVIAIIIIKHQQRQTITCPNRTMEDLIFPTKTLKAFKMTWLESPKRLLQPL